LEEPDVLRQALCDLTAREEAFVDGMNDYGTFWRIEGELIGPTGGLPVVLIWLQWVVDGTFHFVTLKPRKDPTS
jgi:hypothetical protein